MESKWTTIVVMKRTIPQITKSKTRAAIFEIFFNDPQGEYYLRQLEKITGYSAANIRREIIRLEESGLLLSRPLGNIKLYKVDASYPLYSEIKKIVSKTVGIESGLKNIVRKYKKIQFAFIYGSFAEGKQKSLSDIDIILIGDIAPKVVNAALFRYQSKIGREINIIVYSPREFLSNLRDKNHFLSSVAKKTKIFLKGTPNEFRKFVQVRKNTKA